MFYALQGVETDEDKTIDEKLPILQDRTHCGSRFLGDCFAQQPPDPGLESDCGIFSRILDLSGDASPAGTDSAVPIGIVVDAGHFFAGRLPQEELFGPGFWHRASV